MAEREPVSISIDEAIAQLTFLPDRTPAGVDEHSADAFRRLSDYRDGGIFVGHWAGRSEWERHTVGDEIVMIVDGGFIGRHWPRSDEAQRRAPRTRAVPCR